MAMKPNYSFEKRKREQEKKKKKAEKAERKSYGPDGSPVAESEDPNGAATPPVEPEQA